MARPVASISGVLLMVFVCAVSLRAAPATAEKWIEVRSPHFVVVSNAGEKQARQAADQFEQFRTMFQTAFPKTRSDPGQPVIIFAVKNEKSLKELIPQYWEKKGNMHPIGVFQAGADKHYVALRLDSSEDNPFKVIYHEYVHLLVNLNFSWLPVWLNEGLAEFFSSATLKGSETGLGKADVYHLELLQEKRIPLEGLLSADASSPYYNEANRASVFYAESWALTHYLFLDKGTGHRQQLMDYLTLVQQGVNPGEAFRKTFGDLKQFQKVFDNYTNQSRYFYVPVKLDRKDDLNAYPVRELGAAESAAARGDFYVHTNRPAEAKPALEEAMKLDPKLAAPRESMGLLLYHQGQREEALKWYSEALELDSRNFLAYYFHGQLSFEGRLSPEMADATKKDLSKSIELNPKFAAAYGVLAQLLATRAESADEALKLAKQATELEPGEMHHHIVFARVLLETGHAAAARTLGQRILAAARSQEERAMAHDFLENAARYEQVLAERKQFEEELRRQREEARRAAEEAAAARAHEAREAPVVNGATPAHAGRTPAAKTAPAAPPERRITAPGEGRVSAINCSGKTLDLTLEYYGIKTGLHSEDLWKVEYTTYGQMPKDFNPCTYLKGRNVKVEYTVKTGGTYAGELVSIEIQK